MGVPIAPMVSPRLVFSKVTTGRPWIGCNGLQLPGLPRHHVRLAHGKNTMEMNNMMGNTMVMMIRRKNVVMMMVMDLLWFLDDLDSGNIFCMTWLSITILRWLSDSLCIWFMVSLHLLRKKRCQGFQDVFHRRRKAGKAGLAIIPAPLCWRTNVGHHLSNEEKTWLVGLYKGWETLPFVIGFLKTHCRNPYEPPRIQWVFSWHHHRVWPGRFPRSTSELPLAWAEEQGRMVFTATPRFLARWNFIRIIIWKEWASPK